MFDLMIVSWSVDRSGGLIYLSRDDLKVASFKEDTSLLDICIEENSSNAWRIIGLYGEPSGESKHLTWDFNRNL
jgi:hypothetical protein